MMWILLQEAADRTVSHQTSMAPPRPTAVSDRYRAAGPDHTGRTPPSCPPAQPQWMSNLTDEDWSIWATQSMHWPGALT